MPANWDTLQPTAGTPGNSFELGLDLFIGAAWLNAPDITALNATPSSKPRTRDTYAAKGQSNPSKYARDWAISVNVEIVRDNAKQYQGYLQYMLDKALLLKEDNKLQLRIFDVLGSAFALQGTVDIELNRPNTGSDDAGWWGFAMNSIGGLTSIPNPVGALAVPAISQVYPATGATGDAVFLHGANFTGATAVKFGATNATGFTVVDDRHIRAIVPAGSAGAANLTVTTPNGTSAALAFSHT